jgi:glycosyltransferase 2 family protein
MSLSPSAPVVSKRFSRRTILKWTLTLVILGVMGGWIYFKGDELQAKLREQWSESKLSFSEFGYGVFLLAFSIYFVSLLSTFFRWRVLITALGVPLGKLDCVRLGFVGYVSSMFLPGSVSGDVVKGGFFIHENKDRKLATVASIVVDRFIGLYSLFLLASLVGIVNLDVLGDTTQKGVSQLRMALFTIWGISLTGILVFLLFIFLPLEGKGYLTRLEKAKWGGRFFAKVLRAFGQYRRHPGAIVNAVLLGMVGHVGFVFCYYFASLALPGPGPTPPWQVHFLIIPFFMVFQAVPLTFGGNLGVGDVVLGGLYEMLGAMLTKGILASLFQRVIAWGVALIGLLWYVPLHRRRRHQARAMKAMPHPTEPHPAAV